MRGMAGQFAVLNVMPLGSIMHCDHRPSFHASSVVLCAGSLTPTRGATLTDGVCVCVCTIAT